MASEATNIAVAWNMQSHARVIEVVSDLGSNITSKATETFLKVNLASEASLMTDLCKQR